MNLSLVFLKFIVVLLLYQLARKRIFEGRDLVEQIVVVLRAAQEEGLLVLVHVEVEVLVRLDHRLVDVEVRDYRGVQPEVLLEVIAATVDAVLESSARHFALSVFLEFHVPILVIVLLEVVLLSLVLVVVKFPQEGRVVVECLGGCHEII